MLALVGMDEVRFASPLAPGQALTVDVEVTDRRPTSRPDRHLLDLTMQARSEDRLIASARATFLFTSPDDHPTT